MLELSIPVLTRVTDKAMRDAADHPRWLAAIGKAVVQLLSNPYMERDADHGGLLIGSPSGRVYTSNGVCQCEAYQFNRPCWHRAAARLVRLHDEQQAKQEIDADQRTRWAEAQAAMDELYA